MKLYCKRKTILKLLRNRVPATDQQSLARYMGCSESQLTKMLNGDRSIPFIWAYRMHDYLFAWTGGVTNCLVRFEDVKHPIDRKLVSLVLTNIAYYFDCKKQMTTMASRYCDDDPQSPAHIVIHLKDAAALMLPSRIPVKSLVDSNKA